MNLDKNYVYTFFNYSLIVNLQLLIENNLKMIKEIFTWWNKQTFGTRLNTILFGKLVGEDNSGNKYYESKSGKRWVIYNGEVEASKIPSEWYSWIHHTLSLIHI